MTRLHESPAPEPVGVVLAGGASRRMGRDKATLEIDGESLVARAAARLAEVCREVVIADGGRAYLPSHPSLPDGPGRGPVAGLLGAALARPGRPLLALACDLPAVPAALLAELAHLARGGAERGLDWVVPRGARGLEPLAAFYGPAAIAVLERRVAEGRLDLHGLSGEPELTVLAVEPESLGRFGKPEVLFRNLNEPRDLRDFSAAEDR